MLQCWTKMTSGVQQFAPLFIRLTLGIVFFAHGADKLFGWYGGGGFHETVGMMQALHLEPANVMAAMSGGGEMLGGILVFLGLFTRFGAMLIAGTMVVAIATVHLSGGLFARDNGFEYPLTVLGAALTLMTLGAGRISLDAVLFQYAQKRQHTA